MTTHKNQTNTVPPPQSELHRLYVVEGLSCERIGLIYDLAATTIWKWLKRYGIPVRSKKAARAIAVPPVYTGQSLANKQAAAAAMRTKIGPEARAKHAAAMKGRTPPNKGVPWTDEKRAKIMAHWEDPDRRRKASERQRGDKSPRWRGGAKSELNRRLDTAEWRRTRKEVYARDNWICQDCRCKCKNSADAKNDGRKKIQAHHLLARRDGGTDTLDNLITLCMSCHHKRESALKERRAEGKPVFLPRM